MIKADDENRQCSWRHRPETLQAHDCIRANDEACLRRQSVRRARGLDIQTCLALGQLVQVPHKSGAIDVIRNAALGSKGTMS